MRERGDGSEVVDEVKEVRRRRGSVPAIASASHSSRSTSPSRFPQIHSPYNFGRRMGDPKRARGTPLTLIRPLPSYDRSNRAPISSPHSGNSRTTPQLTLARATAVAVFFLPKVCTDCEVDDI
jgi:hypothetical protein